MTPKKDVQKMASKIRKEIDKFSNLQIENISGNHLETEKWSKILKF